MSDHQLTLGEESNGSLTLWLAGNDCAEEITDARKAREMINLLQRFVNNKRK
ncbi:hypothetical protein SEA_CHELMS_76 [Gordonia phage Chelms]|uniref:Uncharacterized protein n=1 Tax=Gordonia phage Chelms TaxID=2588132 RepID=A0A4Y6EHS0_9CAUD|nr:hypothetical protein HWC24_gp053 [Gordonia phage Chelms]QDF18290.1 hypothetical protein SEA_CHELMS_76 [Gordonia phage Chelms]QOR56220.1 hypothetical protein SEA_LINETTI_76 [Gordonia phage Linetti]